MLDEGDKKEIMNKSLYKLLLLILKYLPICDALIHAMHLFLGFFGINAVMLTFLGGTTLLPLLFTIVSSVVLKFCTTHRLPLYYCAVDAELLFRRRR